MAQGSPLGPAIRGQQSARPGAQDRRARSRRRWLTATPAKSRRGTALTTTNPVVQANFSLNGLGNQPPVSQGAYGIIFGSLGTQAIVGPIYIEAVDSTATNAGNSEVVDTIPALPVTEGCCIVRPFAASLAAGVDSANGPLANVVGLRAVITMAGTTTTATGEILRRRDPVTVRISRVGVMSVNGDQGRRCYRSHAHRRAGSLRGTRAADSG